MKISDFKLERYFAKYEFSVEHLLCGSDCESHSIKEILDFEDGASEKFNNHWLGYTESQGSPALRKEIAGLYQTIEPSQILVHSGAEEAIFLFMHALLNAGDHVIVQWPCYQSLFEVAKSIGCEITKWNTQEETGWSLDFDELRKSIKPNTKAIIINSPHNPTGFLLPREKFDELNRIAAENKIILFSDEVYRESEYKITDRLPAACDMGEHAVSLGVMSKTYGLAGLRIGWIATKNNMIYKKMAALKDYTTICNSAPSEFLAELALRHRGLLIDRNVGIITSNLAILKKFFEKHSDKFSWHKPVAGPISFPRLLEGNIEQFCDKLVKSSGVLLLPGSLYDHKGNNFRIGFGRKNFSNGIKKFDEYLESNH